MSDVDRIYDGDKLIAILVPSSYQAKGIEFFTSNNLAQQMAYISHPPGWIIESHVHNPLMREFEYTNEALFLRKGRVRVDFYNDGKEYLWSIEIAAGDVLLLISGGHGFEVIEECEMIEIKQGPYAGERDKTRFPAVSADRVQVKRVAI